MIKVNLLTINRNSNLIIVIFEQNHYTIIIFYAESHNLYSVISQTVFDISLTRLLNLLHPLGLEYIFLILTGNAMDSTPPRQFSSIHLKTKLNSKST